MTAHDRTRRDNTVQIRLGDDEQEMLEYLAREQHASKSETIRHLITRRYQERSSYGQAQPQEQAGSRQAELDDTPDFLKPVQHDTMAQEKDKWRPRDFSKAGQAKGGKR